MFSTMIKSPAIVILCLCLAFVHWLGATVYSANIEHDIATRTQQEINTHRVEVPDILRAVDGRDVSLYGSASNELARITAGEETRSVWGVRVLDNNIRVDDADVAPLIVPEPDMSVPFSLHAQHDYPDLRITGQVDKPAYDLIAGVHQALPPDSSIDYDSLRFDAKELQKSARIVETGIAAVTQLNPGRLTITAEMSIVLVSHDLGFVSGWLEHVLCVNRDVHLHPTASIDGKTLREIFGGDIVAVRHDHDCPPGDHVHHHGDCDH